MLEKTPPVQGPLGGRVEGGTPKGSTAAVVYMVVLESYQTVCPHKQFTQKATGKKSEGERGEKYFQNNHLLTDTDQQKATEKPNQEIKEREFKCRPELCCCTLSPKQRARVHYLVGISMSEYCVVLPWAVAGSVFVHRWGGGGFFQQTALCRRGEKEFKMLL